MLPINVYPYMNLEDLNLDYILKKIMKLETDVQDFVEMNAIKYADPIQWNITTQYEKNTIVIDPATGSAYLSVRPVPAGIDISRTEYWTEVFNLSALIQDAVRNLTEHDAGISTVATFASAPGEWIMWKDLLYIVTSQITPGDAYTVGGNIARLTVEEAIKTLVSEIEAAINNIGSLNDLETTDKTTAVAAINELHAGILAAEGEINDANARIDAAGIQIENVTTVDFARSDLRAIRYGSGYVGFGVQSALNVNGTWIIAYERGSNKFAIATLTADFAISNEYIYSEDCHPNAMFTIGNALFVVDSRNNDLIAINLASFTFISRNTAYRASAIFGGGNDENGTAYLLGMSGSSPAVFEFDGTSTVKTIILEDYDLPSTVVIQGLFVAYGVAYIVCNMPNELVAYDMESGKRIAVKSVGLGDGYFPYGEIETIFHANGGAYMLTAYYAYRAGYIDTSDTLVFNIFRVNIGSEIPSESVAGQAYPTATTLYINENAPKTLNPNGDATRPFNNAYEASCVFNYLYLTYQYKGIISLLSNVSKPLVFANCTASFEITPHKVAAVLVAVNSTIHMQNAEVTKLFIAGGALYATNANFGDLNAYYSRVTIEVGSITTALTLRDSPLFGEVAIPANATITRSAITKSKQAISLNPSPSAGVQLNNLIKATLQQEYTVCAVSFIAIFLPGDGNAVHTRCSFVLNAANKTALANGTPYTVECDVIIRNSANTPAIARLSVTIDANYRMEITVLDIKLLTGGAVTGVSTYVSCVDVESYL